MAFLLHFTPLNINPDIIGAMETCYSNSWRSMAKSKLTINKKNLIKRFIPTIDIRDENRRKKKKYI